MLRNGSLYDVATQTNLTLLLLQTLVKYENVLMNNVPEATIISSS